MTKITDVETSQRLSQLEDVIAYSFRDSTLLAAAMTHRSYANESSEPLVDNERLEFLGDAVLDLVVSEFLMAELSDQDEGVLTQTRAEVVAMTSLAGLAKSLGIGSCLLLGRGEERSGGRDKASLLADALEALIGAVFTDGGYEAARAVVLPLFTPLLKQANEEDQDFKSRLQEALQARQRSLPTYRLLKTSGPDHERVYHVQVLLDGKTYGEGQGRSKKNAEQAAAKSTLQSLGYDK